MVLIQAIFYLGIIVVTRLARPNAPKFCYRRSEKNSSLVQISLKLMAVWSIFAAYLIPFFIIPRTIHPLLGWSLYLFGSFALSSIAINAFLLPMLAILTPWLGIFGSLLVMAYPWYLNGVVRALAIFGYAFCFAPFIWVSTVKVMTSLQLSLEREPLFPRLGESSSPPGFNKLYWGQTREWILTWFSSCCWSRFSFLWENLDGEAEAAYNFCCTDFAVGSGTCTI